MNDVVINNNCKYNLDKIVETLTFSALESLQLDNISISINLVTNSEITKLNKDYRNKNSVTDVITFSYEDDCHFNNLFKVRELGDIFIAVDYVYENSLKLKHSFAREMSFVIVHGILHTLGYDHNTVEEQETMFTIQEEIISNIVEKGCELNAIFS